MPFTSPITRRLTALPLLGGLWQRMAHLLSPVCNPMALKPANPIAPLIHDVACPLRVLTRGGGDTSAKSLGQGRSFYGLKPYIAGDDTRLLDWSVYARTRHPHIRQYQQDARQTLWCVVLDGPEWHTGHHTPLWQFALDALSMTLGTENGPDVSLGIWWLNAQSGWASHRPQPADLALGWLAQAWQKGPTQLYPDCSVKVIPEQALRRDHWLVLAPMAESRLAACQQWPIPPSRLALWAFADPWWQRWQTAMAGANCVAGQQTLPLLTDPGQQNLVSYGQLKIIDTAKPLAPQLNAFDLHNRG